MAMASIAMFVYQVFFFVMNLHLTSNIKVVIIVSWLLLLLVGGIPTPLKNMSEFVSWDDDIPCHSQVNLESHNPFHGSSHHQAVMGM